MKTFFNILIILLFFTACRKSDLIGESIQTTATNRSDLLQSCNFGMSQFNTIKKARLEEEAIYQPDVPEPGAINAVLLLDFDGHTVSNTSWNYAGTIVCSPANLSSTAISEIIIRVSEDFSPFNITVTTNENLFNQCNPQKRMRVIVTETWEWFGQSGGVSFIGSFTWGNNTPCFVFSVLLNYNTKKIAEAISHETGHTLGLYHQSLYNAGCSLLGEYYGGQGTGELSWAPIMGLGYYRNITTWRRGSSIIGCSNIQDDISVITGILGVREDDHPNQFGNATEVFSRAAGCINNSTDVDFFSVDLNSTSTIQISPFNVGMNNEGANMDLLIRIYSRTRSLIATLNDPNSLSVSTTLAPGYYLISVEIIENLNTGRYGQLGNYTLSIN